MRKLIAVLCLFTMTIYAENTKRTIIHIDHDTFELGTIVTFTLSDYSTWKKFVHIDHEHILHTICDQLHAGDEVIMTEKPFSKHFCIQKSDTRKIPVGMTKATKQLLPTIKSIQKIMVKEAGWFSKAEYAHDVTLSDGSVYRQSNEAILHYWKIGDAIIINDGEKEAYLVNVDAEHYVLTAEKGRFDPRGGYFAYRI